MWSPPTRPARSAACGSSARPRWSGPAATSWPAPGPRPASRSPSWTSTAEIAARPPGAAPPGRAAPGGLPHGDRDEDRPADLLDPAPRRRGAHAGAGRGAGGARAGRHGVDARPRRRRVLPAGRPARCGCGSCRSPTCPARAWGSGSCARSRCCGRRSTPAAYDIVHAQDCISANAVDRCVRTVHHLDQFTTPELAACHERAIVRPYAHVCVSAAVAGEVHDGLGQSTPRSSPTASTRPGSPAAVPGDRARAPYVPGASAASSRARARSTCSRRTRCSAPIVPGAAAGDRRRRDAVRLPRLPRAVGDAGRRAGRRPGGARPGRRTTSCRRSVAGAAVFAFPSTKEGFGLAAMEALAAGVPVVVRDLPVLREVFGAGGQLRHRPGVAGRGPANRDQRARSGTP